MRTRLREGRALLKRGGGTADLTGMKTFTKMMSRLVRDEQGGEVLEYALVAGLIVVAAIAVIGSVGTKVLARWTSLNNSL
jgi:pilus assembly protein Flp/PilA